MQDSVDEQICDPYEFYAQIREAYDKLILLEDDLLRREQLLNLRAQLDEDNR